MENGLSVVTIEMPQMLSASIGVWVRVGGRFETKKQNGMAHFVEHMLFKGTKNRSASTISQEIEGMGGYLNAFTSEENTCYYVKAGYRKLDRLLDVLMDMILHSTFPTVELEKERSVIKEELAMYQDQPSQLVLEMLSEIMWPNHPLGRSLTGTRESLDWVNRPRLRTFWSRYYGASNMVIATAGRVRHQDLLKKILPYSMKLPSTQTATFKPCPAKVGRFTCQILKKPVEQTQVAIGFHALSRIDPSRYAMRILNTILADNMSSRLFQILREDQGLVYSVYGSTSFFEDTGSLVLAAGLESRNYEKTCRLLKKELTRLRVEPVTKDEWERAVDYLIGQLDLSLENTENAMMWCGESMLHSGSVLSKREIRSRLKAVKRKEVMELACRLFRDENMSLAIVTPKKSNPSPNALLMDN